MTAVGQEGGANKVSGNITYRGKTQAWWSVSEFMEPGITHQRVGRSLTGPTAGRVLGSRYDDEDLWDLTDSLADLYTEVNKRSQSNAPRTASKTFSEVEIKKWLNSDTNHGFVRIYMPDTEFQRSQLVPCSLTTAAHQICALMGLPPNCLHVQQNGDIIRRMDPYEHPLMIQNEYLATIGFTDITKIQEEGIKEEFGYLIRFYSGKPFHDGTYSRNQLMNVLEVRKGKVLPQWTKRLCIITGTRLFIYRDKTRNSQPAIVQLAKGSVQEVKFKGRGMCLKLTASLQGEKSIYLSFNNEGDYQRWYKKAKKATSKLPTSADLSNCHLEFLPETIFINDELSMLNLRHNVLKERPIEEDIYTIGWLDDLPRFPHLRSLNLADNDLRVFPLSICQLRTLIELNLASNKMEEVPPQISQLFNLQALHLHNNHLTQLPDDMMTLKKLVILVLAFNRFTTIPPVVASMVDTRVSDIENLIMAGNNIEKLPDNLLVKLKYVKKIDFRMNSLTLSPNETVKFSMLEHLTHIDIRDNNVQELDIRGVRTLEFLTCERNGMRGLQLNGSSLKQLYAMHNKLEYFSVTPKPEWLENMDVSNNRLKKLPDWSADCFFLQKLVASYNRLTELPRTTFCNAKKLRVLKVDHNELEQLPEEIEVYPMEELHIEHNNITALPEDFLKKGNKLRLLNATNNKLISLPEVNAIDDLNKMQELYLAGNYLQDDSMRVISGYVRLKVLNLANNDLQDLPDRYLEKLDMLQDMNVSANKLRFLPETLGILPDLRVLRAHSNLLRNLPDLRGAKNLKVLDVGCNRLLDVSVTDLMSSQINLLDMSCNNNMKLDKEELKNVKRVKNVSMVDMTGQNRLLPGGGNNRSFQDEEQPWIMGFTETSGIRNKLCVSVIKDPNFRGQNEALFGMFDGGRNSDVTRLLAKLVPRTLTRELEHPKTADKAVRYAFLIAHRQLREKGQRLGASGVLCYIKRLGKKKRWTLQLVNVGDVGAVLCRGGEPTTLTRLHTVAADRDECQRIRKSSGIITEDNRVNGSSSVTRMIGCSYMFPQIIPEPSEIKLTLRRDDEFLIIANGHLWTYVSHQEAVQQVANVTHPVVAAKRLQDLAQSYGAKESLSILVVRLNFDSMYQYTDSTPSSDGDDTLDHRRRLKNGNVLQAMLNGGYNADSDSGASETDPEFVFQSGSESGNGAEVQVRPLPNRRYRKKDDVEQWEGLLQKRISSQVKDRELQYTFGDETARSEETISVSNEEVSAASDNNWQSLSRQSGQETAAKLSEQHLQRTVHGSMKGRLITCPPVKPNGNSLSDTNLNAGELNNSSPYFSHKPELMDSTDNVPYESESSVCESSVTQDSETEDEPGYATISYPNQTIVEESRITSSEETLKGDDDNDNQIRTFTYRTKFTSNGPVMNGNMLYDDNIDDMYAKIKKNRQPVSDDEPTVDMSISDGNFEESANESSEADSDSIPESEDARSLARVASITISTHM